MNSFQYAIRYFVLEHLHVNFFLEQMSLIFPNWIRSENTNKDEKKLG